LLPACSGIVISSAPRRLRPLASSVAYTSYNLLGYAASNYFPGLVMNLIVRHTPSEGPFACDTACTYRIGFRIVLFWSSTAFGCLVAAYFFSEQKLQHAIEEEERTGRRPASGSVV
jgi:MFS transporter, Spinster family, sphingosine-1-phosphate transporter